MDVECLGLHFILSTIKKNSQTNKLNRGRERERARKKRRILSYMLKWCGIMIVTPVIYPLNHCNHFVLSSFFFLDSIQLRQILKWTKHEMKGWNEKRTEKKMNERNKRKQSGNLLTTFQCCWIDIHYFVRAYTHFECIHNWICVYFQWNCIFCVHQCNVWSDKMQFN